MTTCKELIIDAKYREKNVKQIRKLFYSDEVSTAELVKLAILLNSDSSIYNLAQEFYDFLHQTK